MFWAALKRFETHKRLMVVAAVAALGAGFFRLILFLSGFHPLSLPAGVLGCSLFILVAMCYEWVTRRSVHAVYWIGLVALLGVEVMLLPQLNGDLVSWIDGALAAIGQDLGAFYRPEPTVDF